MCFICNRRGRWVLLTSIFAIALVGAAFAQEQQRQDYLRNGESIDEYAVRTGLKPTVTIALDSDCALEASLIPAGEFDFNMPSPKPGVPVYSISLLFVCAIGLVVVCYSICRRPSKKFHFGLRMLLFVSILIGVTMRSCVGLIEYRKYNLEYERMSAVQGIYNNISHRAVISHAFYLGTKEVSRKQYASIKKDLHLDSLDAPVEDVSWEEADAFCKALSAKSHLRVYLPTEVQWEFACRGMRAGLTRDELQTRAWFGDNSRGHVHEGGGKLPNFFGLYDMQGNVWEWCSDLADKTDVPDPEHPSRGLLRILRGGSWADNYYMCGCSVRLLLNQNAREFSENSINFNSGSVGFRVAIDIP